MAQPRQTSPWIAFVAGAVAMLAVALLAWAWMQRQAGLDLARTVVDAADVAPDLSLPPMPDAPRLPDAPVPQPR
ncbi:MAG: hypothetical protein AB1942_04610 [Pseudomonadota bacterium]